MTNNQDAEDQIFDAKSGKAINVIKGFVTAVRTLTIIPVPGRNYDGYAAALPWFPVVGLLLAFILCGIGVLWIQIGGDHWPQAGAVLLLGAQVFLTRGLHLDGLADWADALGGHTERTRRLSIMRDSHLGTFGVLALFLALMAKWIAMERLIITGALSWLLVVLTVSRGMLVVLLSTLPYARTGEGLAAPFVLAGGLKQRVIAQTVTLCVCVCFGPFGLVLFGVGRLVTKLLGTSFRKGFGGITGDLLGTTNEIVEVVLLTLCAAAGMAPLPWRSWDSWI
jgi:adenosylcobinamide-GDP ribazoletransferase